METALRKAKADPKSIKAKILSVARKDFGQHGFRSTTTRMIAREVGIDISTLYYHWGDKDDLYRAVIMEVSEDIRQKLIDVEKVIKGMPLSKRIEIGIEMVADYLFENPEIPTLAVSGHLEQISHKGHFDLSNSEFISNIAVSMDLAKDRRNVPPRIKMQVLVQMNAIYTFVLMAGTLQKTFEMTKEEYIALAKETLKFIIVPPFTKASVTERQKKKNG